MQNSHDDQRVADRVDIAAFVEDDPIVFNARMRFEKECASRDDIIAPHPQPIEDSATYASIARKVTAEQKREQSSSGAAEMEENEMYASISTGKIAIEQKDDGERENARGAAEIDESETDASVARKVIVQKRHDRVGNDVAEEIGFSGTRGSVDVMPEIAEAAEAGAAEKARFHVYSDPVPKTAV